MRFRCHPVIQLLYRALRPLGYDSSFQCLVIAQCSLSECSKNKTLVAPQSPTEYNFSSPYYPYGYHRNKTCGWYITAPENHVLKLHFLPQLNNWNTLKHSVQIYDMEDSDLTTISLQSWKIYSKFRSVYVVFKSDEKVDGGVEQGIFVNYSAIKTGKVLGNEGLGEQSGCCRV